MDLSDIFGAVGAAGGIASAAIAVPALFIARRAQKLAEKLAEDAGRLGAARIEPRSERDGRTIDLVVENGPTRVRIDEIYLNVTYRCSGSWLLAGPTVSLSESTPTSSSYLE